MGARITSVIEHRPWGVVLGSIAVAVALFFALPPGGLAQAVLAESLAVGMAVAVAVRLVREGWAWSLPWVHLLLAAVLYGAISPIWGLTPVITGRDLPYPSWLDGVYFVSYGFAAAFLLGLIRARYRSAGAVRRPDLVALVDAAIFAVAATSLLWPLVTDALRADAVVGPLTLGVGVGYLAFAAVLAGLAIRLLTADLRRSAVHWLLLLWIGGELAGDVFYGQLAASGAFYPGHPITVTWLVSSVALILLAVHPRLGELVAGKADLTLGGWRLWMPLGVALVPFVSLVLHRSLLIEVLAGVAIVLNIVRLRLLSDDLAEQRRTSDELADAVAELEHANRSLENFAAVASHDLRSPLATVHALLETLTARPTGNLAIQDREILDRSLRHTTRLLETIEALLTLSRAESAQLSIVRVDLDGLLSEVTGVLETELAEAGAELEHGPLPVVDGDPALLRVLLQNLLTNAIRYRDPDRALAVRVSAERSDGRVEIAVTDNGRGFDPQDRERIFELFGRTTQGEKLEGSGIGLATCRRIAEQHGGTIHANPRNEGAQFVVTLPQAPIFMPRSSSPQLQH